MKKQIGLVPLRNQIKSMTDRLKAIEETDYTTVEQYSNKYPEILTINFVLSDDVDEYYYVEAVV